MGHFPSGGTGRGITPPAGDIGGTTAAPLVVGLDGIPIVGTPSSNQVLEYNGTDYVPVTPAAGDATIITAGNLGATPTVALAGAAVTQVTGTLTANCAMTVNGLTAGCSAILLLSTGAGGYTLSINGASVTIPTAASTAFAIEVWSPDGSTLYIQPGSAVANGTYVAAIAGPPTTGTWVTGQSFIDTANLLWICTAGGTPGTWTLGPQPSVRDVAFAPTGTWETISRVGGGGGGVAQATGVLNLYAIWLPKGFSVGHFTINSSGTPAGTPTNWWMALYDNNRVQLAITADQTTTAFGTYTTKTLAVATTAAGAASSFVTTYSGLHYVGFMMKAATLPTITSGYNVVSSTVGGAPLLMGTSDTGQTTPPAFPHTATTIASTSSGMYYIYLSN